MRLLNAPQLNLDASLASLYEQAGSADEKEHQQ